MAILLVLAPASFAEETVDLRGYGKVTADFAPGRAAFVCQSADKAEILQDKLLADLLWNAPEADRAGKTIRINGREATAYEIPGHGAIVVGRVEGKVLALGGADASVVAKLAAKEELLADPRCRFKADKPHPVYLDFFDLSAVKIFTYAMQSQRGEGLSNHWPFLRKFGLNAIAYSLGGGMISAKSPARGVLNFVDTDYEVREAERNHGLIMPSISTGGSLPAWATNLFPESVLQLSPTGIAATDHTIRQYESYGMPRQEREITGLWSLRETMRRYLNSPAVGGYKLYDGPVGIELTHGYMENADFSPTGIKSYREWLKNVKGFDLKALGLRYYNDAARYKSWEDVMPLDANGFFGNLDESCLLLKDWQCQLANSSASEPPAGSDSNWRQLVYPGSDQMHTIPDADAFYRIDFDAAQWIAKNANKELFLIVGSTRAKKPNQIKVWLNGTYLGEKGEWNAASRSRPASVKVDGLLKPGSNELKLRVPGGKLLSPFFLTTHKAEEYPSSDKGMNARYVDLKDWHGYTNITKHREMMELARGVDANRPFIFTTGSGWEMADDIAEISRTYGTSSQNTGREVYQPWWPRLGRTSGFYGSSEPGSTVTPDATKPMSLGFMFGSILLDGDAAHTLYWILEDYIRIERETGWFTKNQRLLSLVGKSLSLPPEIIIFRSAQTMRYDHHNSENWGSAPYRWDLGRGEMNSAHFNWGYTSEGGIRRGLPRTCKVLMDAGSEFMDQATIDAITSFVSNGGTYVALHNTGRHDPIEANTWPISRLTGCKVVGEKAKGKIRFESDLPVFKGWEGRELEAEGIALDSRGNDHGKDKSIRLSPQSGDVKVLAKWADGTAAVTCRTIGKGRVVCLGSTFWRNARDKGGAWLTPDDKLDILERLFTDLGVRHESDASSAAVWINDNITKNGLERWLVAANTLPTPVVSDLKFRLSVKPAEVRELTSNQTVPFDYADGWVHLKATPFDSAQAKVFSVKRADLADGLAYWWAEKTTYWKKFNVPEVKDDPRDAGRLGTFTIDSWKFLADRDGNVSAQNAWNAPQFSDAAWDTIETGPWNTLKEELKDYTGIGLYRVAFTIPAQWKGSTVSLNLYGYGAPKIFGEAEFYLNGKKIQGSPFYQDLGRSGYPARIVIDDYLVGGRNVLAVKIKGGAQLSGENFSGFRGCVYLEAEKPLEPAQKLDDPWTLVRLDDNASPVSLPASKISGKYLAKEFTIPASWKNRQIHLRLETTTPWLEGVMINGKLLLSAQFRRLGRYNDWNVTSWVEPGKTVRIELWSKALPLYNPFDPQKIQTDNSMDLLSAEIGCRD